MKSTKKMVARFALFILFFIVLIPMGAVFSSSNFGPQFTSSASYLYAPYNNTGVKVHQGYVSHFAYYSTKHRGCGYYYPVGSKNWISTDYTPREETDGVLCSHDGIDYFLGKSQISALWKPFDVIATIKGEVNCGYSSVLGHYITQEQIYEEDQIKVRYAHLRWPSKALRNLCNTVVEPGTKIGVAGDTGISPGEGIYLHLDVWRNGTRIDPYGINNTWDFYPPVKTVDWGELTHVWFVENGSIKIFRWVPTPTNTKTLTSSPTLIPTCTTTQTATLAIFLPSATPSTTRTPSLTPSGAMTLQTNTPTPAPTRTPQGEETATSLSTLTFTPSTTRTPSSTPSRTTTPRTNTPTLVPTRTPYGEETATPLSPTLTFTPFTTYMPSSTPSGTLTPQTNTPTPVPTRTPHGEG